MKQKDRTPGALLQQFSEGNIFPVVEKGGVERCALCRIQESLHGYGNRHHLGRLLQKAIHFFLNQLQNTLPGEVGERCALLVKNSARQ